MFKKWIKSFFGFFRMINRTSPQESLASLIAYIPFGSLAMLQYWTSALSYRNDKEPRDEWEDADVVIARDGNCDCEEKACINAQVIKSWPDHKSEVLALIHRSDVKKNHAICFFGTPSACGYMDDSGVFIFAQGALLQDILREHFPETKMYAPCTYQGFPKGRFIVL